MRQFVTTAGEEIEYGPIALDDLQLAQEAVRAEFKDRDEPIDPPTYQVEILGSTEKNPLFETHPHTEETIKDGTEDEKIAWQEHLEAVERMQDEIQSRTALIFLDAIKVELPKDEKWVKRRKQLFGEDVPEDEDERLLFYVNKVLLKTPHDKNDLMQDILDYSMSGAPGEVVEAYKKLFRSTIEEQGRAAIKLIETIEGPESKQEVVLQPVDATGNGGERVGDVTKSIQKTARKG